MPSIQKLSLLSSSLFCIAASLLAQQPATSGRSFAAAGSTSTTTTPAPTPGAAEQWDQLTVVAKDFDAIPPMVGEKASFPTYTSELVRVQWRQNDPIDLYIIRPKSESNPPVILYLYGFPSDTDRFRSDAFCNAVTQNGFAAVGFVSALTGQRYHHRPMNEWFVSDLQEALGASVHDVQMILNYLATRGDLDMDRVGMYGQGSGGTITILAAAVDSRVKAVDVMDPWADWPEWLAKSPQIPQSERATYLTPDFLAKVAPLDPLRLVAKLGGRPFRVQENLFNLGIPDTVRKSIEAALPTGANLVEYRDTQEYSEKVARHGKMLEWLDAALGPVPTQPPSAQRTEFEKARP